LSQELFYQIQHSSVCDALSHEGHETVVRDVVKVSFNIDIHYVVMAALEKSFDFSQGVLATASGPKSIAAGCELAFEYGFDDQFERALHHAVFDRGDAKGALFGTAGLADFDPSDGLGLVAVFAQLLFYDEQSLCAVFGEHCYAHRINATGSCVGSNLLPGHPKGSFCRDFINQTEPLVSFFSSVEDFEHGFGPYPAFGSVALQGQRGGGVFNLFIPLAFASGN
jgi:hypothetical protein